MKAVEIITTSFRKVSLSTAPIVNFQARHLFSGSHSNLIDKIHEITLPQSLSVTERKRLYISRQLTLFADAVFRFGVNSVYILAICRHFVGSTQ